MRKPPVFIFLFLYLGNAVIAQPDIPAAAEKLFKDVMKAIDTRHVTGLKRTGREMSEKKSSLESEDFRKAATQYARLENIKNADVEALSFLILMQTIKFAKDDLLVTQEKLQFLNKIKSEQEEMLAITQKADLENSMSFAFYDSIEYLSDRNIRQAKGVKTDSIKFKSSGNRKKVHPEISESLVFKLKADLLTLTHLKEIGYLEQQKKNFEMNHMVALLMYFQRGIDKPVDQITKSLK